MSNPLPKQSRPRRRAAVVVLLLLAFAACEFVGYDEFWRVADTTPPVIDATTLKDGRLVALHCTQPQQQCSLRTYRNGALLATTALSGRYRAVDAADDGLVWLLGPGSRVEKWRLIARDQLERKFTLGWGTETPDFGVATLVAGRGDYLYVAGGNFENDRHRGVIARYKVVPAGSGIAVAPQPKLQRLRSDSHAALQFLSRLEVDQTNGLVYVVDEKYTPGTPPRFDPSLISYNEDLSYRDTEARAYGSRPDDLQATAGLLGVFRATVNNGGEADDVYELEVLEDTGTAFFKVDTQTEPNRLVSTPAQFTVERLNDDCAYLWTFGKHSFNTTQNAYNLLGRHGFCQNDARPPH
jgi:hypothetical protein